MMKTVILLEFILENLKNIISFTRFLKKDMYKSPLYGKEWNWRNIKMEAREIPVYLRSLGPGKGFAVLLQ